MGEVSPRRRSWPRVGAVLVGEGLRVHDAAADRGESVLVPGGGGEDADLVDQVGAAGLVLRVEVADLVTEAQCMWHAEIASCTASGLVAIKSTYVKWASSLEARKCIAS